MKRKKKRAKKLTKNELEQALSRALMGLLDMLRDGKVVYLRIPTPKPRKRKEVP